jgi:molybdopterin synthase sulfur carrier subunit
MPVIVVVPSALRRFSDGAARVDLDTSPDHSCALGEVLAMLSERYPGIGARVLDEQGQLRRHVNVFVGTEESRVLGGLAAPVAPGTEIVILPAVSGGT